MIKICNRYNRVQIMGHRGNVRVCGWLKDGGVIGSLATDSLYDIWHSKRANELREQFSGGDYSACEINWCPYLAMNTIENHMVVLDKFPEYPDQLHLAFEETCNYQCTSCRDFRLHPTEEMERSYQNIENKIRDTLPHIKVIGASGSGELFANQHTLNILANWRPLAPKDELAVQLETNGSLFDAEHWSYIENLGQYNLSVSITVMSFEEPIYQILSGTTLPVSQVENNLHFVRKLREKEIVNYFEIATVYQERNFRQLPEFARRCVEEFGADYVRLRPYNMRTHCSAEEDWFTDVRGKYHPYHQEFLKVMRAPIMQHPKVHDWGGGRESAMGTLEEHRRERGKNNVFNIRQMQKYQEQVKRERRKGDILTQLLLDDGSIIEHIKNRLSSPVIVYGLGNIGKALVKILRRFFVISSIIDRGACSPTYEGIPVYASVDSNSTINRECDVLITPLGDYKEIKDILRQKGFRGKLWDLEELLA